MGCPFVEKAGKPQNWQPWDVVWWHLVSTRAIGDGPVRRHAVPLAPEGEDNETGGIPIRIVGQKASRSSPHILLSALTSSSWLADAAADWTPLLPGAVTGAADSEDNTTTEEARRSTSSVGTRPAPNNDNNTRQLVLLRSNGVVRPNLLPPALSSSPLPWDSWSFQGQTALWTQPAAAGIVLTPSPTPAAMTMVVIVLCRQSIRHCRRSCHCCRHLNYHRHRAATITYDVDSDGDRGSDVYLTKSSCL